MRTPSPLQQYKKNFARVVYGKKSNCLSKTECGYIRKLFKSFHPDYHADIVDYPDWLASDWEAIVRENQHRLATCESVPYFLFSENRITKYLQTLYPEK